MTTVTTMSLDELEEKVLEWGNTKGILQGGTPTGQFAKTLEEVSELCTAIEDSNIEEIQDAIGDIVVTLIMQSGLWGLTMKNCLGAAYDVISKRTGRLENGIFIKD